MSWLPSQQHALAALISGAPSYFKMRQDRVGGRLIPYVGQLKAVTGAGKTPILAKTIRPTE